MRLVFLLSLFPFLVLFADVQAQGPPINTDTPIMLGLEGRGVRTFAKFIRMATLRQDGEEIIDDLERKATVRVTPLSVPYNLFSAKLQVGTTVPFIDAELDSRSQTASNFGIGDVSVFLKYLLFQHDRKLETFRVAAKVTLKLPTGDDTDSPPLGTGSTDYALSMVAGWVKNRVGVYGEGIYTLNTSKGRIDYGNSGSYNVAFAYRLLPAVYETYPSPQLNGFFEINGSTSAKNSVDGQQIDSSGGTTIFVSPGLQYIGGRRWLVEASFQYPIVNEPNGTQLATDWALAVGARILIF